MTTPLETVGLGKRYSRKWALRHCTLSIPRGSVTALIGPNGAGKSTLLRLAVGLARPSAGSVAVFGHDPRRDAADVLPRIGYVAQDRPLYHRMTVAEVCNVGAKLNREWDQAYAVSRLEGLGIDLRQKTGKLSGGQQAQVALVLALAKHPELIVLDEPTASLDPLARREFLQVLMDAVAGDGATVLLSSHNVADLERVCDHLVILSHGMVQIADDLDRFLSTHRLLMGPRASERDLAPVGQIVHASDTDRQTTLLVRVNGHLFDARWDVRNVGFEEAVLGYLAQPLPMDEDALELEGIVR
jgi:ABC-2 type transport system ATP-binding protein